MILLCEEWGIQRSARPSTGCSRARSRMLRFPDLATVAFVVVRIQRRSGVVIPRSWHAMLGGRGACAGRAGHRPRRRCPLVGATVRLLELIGWSARTRGSLRFTDVPTAPIGFTPVSSYLAPTDTVRPPEAWCRPLRPDAVRHPAQGDRRLRIAGRPPGGRAVPVGRIEVRGRIDNSPGMSFAEKMTDLPGVTARSNGSTPSRPILQG